MMPHTPGMSLALGLLGLVVGYFSGMFGVGGGFLLTPMLVAVFGVETALAVGSGLTQMTALAAAAAYRHHRQGFVDVRAVACMAPGALAGTVLGRQVLSWLRRLGTGSFAGHQEPVATVVLSLVFMVLMVALALRSWRAAMAQGGATTTQRAPLRWERGPWPVALPASGVPRVSLLALLGGGLVAGGMAGLLGVGGGIIVVPLLAYGMGISLRVAIGSSSLLILLSSAAAGLQYVAAGSVDWYLVVLLLCGSLPGVLLGTAHSHLLALPRLQQAFATLLLIVAGICLWGLFHPLTPR